MRRFALLAAAVIAYPYQWAPGVRNKTMTEGQLCSPDFRTGLIRPSSFYTSRLKRQQLKAHPEIDCSKGCEEDHVWPIEAGGDPRDPQNLSPQPAPDFHAKDRVETWWHDQICAGKMKIDDVKDQLPHWREIYEREFGRTAD